MLESRICETCGKPYTPTKSFQKYCSKDCQPCNIYRKEDLEARRHKLCAWCGIEFYDSCKQNTTKYCSDRCRHLARNSQAADWQSRYYMKKRLNYE